MAAFQAALEAGYGVELDVHLLKDGGLAVIHDTLLNRTTGQPGQIEHLSTAELAQYHLEGTQETIPEFGEVLRLFRGRVPLIIELKSADGNYAALTQAVCQALESYQGVFCLESFDPRCVAWLRKYRPQYLRGQLAENFYKSRVDMPDWQKFAMTHLLANFMSTPDFIAYSFSQRKSTPSVALCRQLWKAQGVSWTLRTQADYDIAVAEGWIPIFEGFRPARQLPSGEETPALP